MSQIRPIYYTDELSIGLTASQSKTITEADIILFSGISTDTNAVHLDEEYAKSTRFKTRIVHGFLTASLISSALANRLPGPGTIFLGQTLKFLAPVHPGDTVTADLRVIEIDSVKNKVRIETVCRVGDRRVIEGEALVLSTARP